jgi:plasmid maintenance system antidote protein VapI
VRGTSNFPAGAASGPLGTTPQLWLNLRTDYDVQMALRARQKLATIEPVAEATSS